MPKTPLPAARVSGVVLGDDGQRLADAVVTARLACDAASGACTQRTALTDSSGRFEVELPPGPVQFTVRSAEWSTRSPVFVELSPAQTIEDLELNTERAFRFSGRVALRGSGAPALSGVWVGLRSTATGADYFSREPSKPDGGFEILGVPPGEYLPTTRVGELVSVAGGPLRIGENRVDELVLAATSFTVKGRLEPPVPATLSLHRVLPLAPSERVLSRHLPANDGRFAIEGVPSGTWRLAATSDDGRVATLDLRVGDEDVSDLALALEPANGLHGAITGPDGTPVSGIDVIVTPEAPREMTAPQVVYETGRALTDENGRFTIDGLADGSHAVELRDAFGRLPWSPLPKPAASSAPRSVLLDGRRDDHELRASSVSCAHSIAGTVLGLEAEPVPHAIVRLRALQPPRAAVGDTGSALATRTDARGRFVFSRLCRTSYSLVASDAAERLSSRASPANAGDEVRLSLAPRPRFRLRVLHGESPVREYSIELAGPSRHRVAVRSADGSFVSPALEPGVYDVTVTAEQGYYTEELEALEGTVERAPIELVAWSNLRGQLKFRSGRPAPSLSVIAHVSPLDSRPVPPLAARHRLVRASTDEEGRFELPRLMAGSGQLGFASGARLLAITTAHVKTGVGALPGTGRFQLITINPGELQDVGEVVVLDALVP